MSSIARPPDPCLVAIIFAIQSRAGPRIVFHYPPNPSTISPSSRRNSRAKSTSKSTDSAASGDEDHSSSDEDDDGTADLAQSTSELALNHSSSDKEANGVATGTLDAASSTLLKSQTKSHDAAEDAASDSADIDAHGGIFHPPWDSLLGLETYVWEKLLSPSPSWHKRRFEVGVNDLAFVGWPVFVRDDGTWGKRRRKKTRKERGWEESESGNRAGSKDSRKEDETPAKISELSALAEIADGASGEDRGTSSADPDSKNMLEQTISPDGDKDSLTMFNVVFVLNPPLLEYNVRVKEKYDNVVKKFGKGLKAEQARVDYVWKEAQTILNLKEKGRENRWSISTFYSEVLAKSSLARSISTLYASISNSRIASVMLNPETTMSLQIPPLTSTPYLPSVTETSYPGLWLTTADSVSATDEATDVVQHTGPNRVLAKHFALLMLADEQTILKDVDFSAGSIGPLLAHYVRSSKPTKSFAQVSTMSSIPLNDIQVLANHLIYWRRARAVPPLNKRDTYIVSPNCDMSKLGPASAAYEAAFPTLPSLPKMLSMLSGPPRPYYSLFPSKDHKDTYYAILAWLLRGGWVTQLRTFAWIKVTPDIKIAVEEQMAREEEAKDEKVAASTVHDGNGKEEKADDLDDDRLSSSSSSLDSESSGEATPVPARYREQQLRHQQQDVNAKPRTSSLILRPHKASPMESRWLDQILATFPEHTSNIEPSSQATHDTEDTESDTSLEKLWPLFTKYFNGTDALEKIPVREGLTRKVVWRWLTKMDSSNRQRDSEIDPREKVLVTVRHW